MKKLQKYLNAQIKFISQVHDYDTRNKNNYYINTAIKKVQKIIYSQTLELRNICR